MSQPDLIVEPSAFWFIWTKTGRIPKRGHDTQMSADVEAFRLALKHPGKKFIVLKSEYKVHAPKIDNKSTNTKEGIA